MISARSLVISISLAVLSAAPLICAQDAKSSEVGVLLQLPLVIQQPELQPQSSFDLLAPVAQVPACDHELRLEPLDQDRCAPLDPLIVPGPVMEVGQV